MVLRSPLRPDPSRRAAISDGERRPSRREALAGLAGLASGVAGALLVGCRKGSPGAPPDAPPTGASRAGAIQVIPVEVTVTVYGARMTENTYVVGNARTKDAVIIDPGRADPRLVEAVTRAGFRIRAVLNTHGHLDHIGGNAELAKRFGVPVWGPQADAALYPMAGLENEPSRWFTPAAPPALPDLGPGLPVARIHTPGHTEGSTCFRVGQELFTGDTLFRGNIGRTWGTAAERAAHQRQEIANIRDRLLPLGDLRVWPGHGPPSTLGWERRHNPHLAPG